MNKPHEDISFDLLRSKLEELKCLTRLENESTTRMRAIDTVLFDVLAWDKRDVETERYCRAEGYADYVFSTKNIPAFVLEAKKSGIDFVLPDRVFENRPYVFGLFAKECSAAAKALQQSIGYAATLGARYVGISNGHQWLLAMTFVQDQPLDARLVYIFESFDAILERFSNFWSCFSPQGVEQNSASKYLIDNLKLPAPPKLSSFVPGYPIPATRNVFQNELSYILDYVWQVMSEDEGSLTFVQNCYVNPGSHEDILALVRELIQKRKNEDEILQKYDIESIDTLPHKLAHLPSERPFVILGEVGRGKSSFLKYLRFVAAKDELKNYIQIEFNFLDRPDKANEIPDFVYYEVERQLRENYKIDIYENSFVRGVLHGDLQRLRATPKGTLLAEKSEQYNELEIEEIGRIQSDRHSYLAKVFHHLKRGREHSLALFFDNLDRRDSDIQEQAFLKASAMARDWSSLVFICLRPNIYYRSQESGVLDAIAPTAFTVGQPDLSLVLKRRFAYAKRIAEGQSLNYNLVKSAPSRNISLDLPKVAKIFESCEFAAWKRHGIIPTLEAVSNGNIRRLIDFARRILCSGHLDTKKILSRIQESGHYYIPDFEGVKTLLYGDYMQYDPSKSPFINLFDVQHADPTEHFFRLATLHYLARIPGDAPIGGYVKFSDLLMYLSTLGYSHNPSTEIIKVMIEKQCIRKGFDPNKPLSGDDRIKITSLGKYHLYSLASIFQYVDAVIIDTPILDAEIRKQIHHVHTIIDRLKRTELFLKYLDDLKGYIRDGEVRTFWESLSSKAKANIEEIRQRLRDNPQHVAAPSA